VEILQWYCTQGETIEMFDKVCEVQSDKATVDISSKYDGIVTVLHYEVGDMARVGAPLIDVKVQEVEADTRVTADVADAADAAGPALSQVAVSSAELWELCDKNGDGQVSRIELIHTLRSNARLAEALGLQTHIRAEHSSHDAFEVVFQGMDVDASKGVTLKEWTAWMDSHHTDPQPPTGPKPGANIQEARHATPGGAVMVTEATSRILTRARTLIKQHTLQAAALKATQGSSAPLSTPLSATSSGLAPEIAACHQELDKLATVLLPESSPQYDAIQADLVASSGRFASYTKP